MIWCCKNCVAPKRYPGCHDHCPTCEKNVNGSCKSYKNCQKWLTRYRYRQRQINAYAKRVLPVYYAQQEKNENG